MAPLNRTLNILPLKLTPHNDRTSILTAYSRELGSVSFAVSAGSGPGAARRRALLMPLNPLEVQSAVMPGRELLRMSEPRALMPLHVILSSPERSAVAMFLAEALAPILRQGEPDARLFDYVVNAVALLNNAETPVANFHLCFLVRLTTLLGIAPDTGNYRRGMLFDMLDARFRRSASLSGHSLPPVESEAAHRLMRMTWRNQGRYRFTGAERAAALERMLQFYTLHHANLSSLRSPAILHSLLH